MRFQLDIKIDDTPRNFIQFVTNQIHPLPFIFGLTFKSGTQANARRYCAASEAGKHSRHPHEWIESVPVCEKPHDPLVVESRPVNSYCARNQSENDDRQEPAPGKIHQITSEEIQSIQGKGKYQETEIN